MTKQEFEEVVKRRPFTPIRLHLSNGDLLNVTHPNGMMVTDAFIAVAVGTSLTFVATDHVVQVEPLPTISA